MKTSNRQFDTDSQNILLVGNVSRAFEDGGMAAKSSCQVSANMFDAIETVAKSSFAAIAVIMAGTSAKLSSALRVLRKVNPQAKIILLAQMHEEPAAMQLVSSASNGQPFADDYLICPISFSSLVSGISRQVIDEFKDRGIPARIGSPVPAAIDAAGQMRIMQLEKLATEDDLTGLKNRRYVWEFSRQIIERAKKANGRVTLLVFDIDNFKHYNDVYGHSAGDKILKQAAVLMLRCCRSHDVVSRVGGDEFVVVFWDDPHAKPAAAQTERRSASKHPTEAIFIAKRFRRELEKAKLHLLGPDGKGVLTISGGLASFPRDGSTIQQLFSQADNALLEAKRSGKNRIYLVGKPQNDIANIE